MSDIPSLLQNYDLVRNILIIHSGVGDYICITSDALVEYTQR